MGLTYGLLDGKTCGILYLIKLYRILALYIVLFVVDKVWQAKYVDDVYVQHGQPPSLILLPFAMVAIEGMAFLLVFVVLLVFERRFKNTLNTFVVDETLLWQVLIDYILTTVCIFVVAIIVVTTITNCSILRYKHDGLRGIRVACMLTFSIACIILLQPCFLVY